MRKIQLSLMMAAIVIHPVHATDLIQIYQTALEQDPIFKQAYTTYESNQEAIPQAFAALYPQISMNNTSANRAYTNIKTGSGVIEQTYNNTQWQIASTQAVFNYQAWEQVKQAKSSVKSAEATFNDAAQNLILRTADAYFSILLAQDTLNFAEAKQRANKRQLDQAKQRFDVGLDAITSVYEAKAAYDQSVALVITAKRTQLNKKESLRLLTNHFYNDLSPLRNQRIPLNKPKPSDVNEWVDIAHRQNYLLFASKYAMEAARDNIKVQFGSGWPVFNLQGNATQVHNDAGPGAVESFFINPRNTNASIGINMTFPVLQGGLVLSKTRQANYDFQTSSQKLEQVYREVEINSRVAYNNIIDGISKVTADKESILSATNSLESTQAQFEVGTRTMVDVVNAQQKLFETQEQLATDQYLLINAMLKLKYTAGTLSVQDLEEVNSWLNTPHSAVQTRHKKT